MTKLMFCALLTVVAMASSPARAGEAAADPVVGTWKLNVSKSTFTSGPALKDQTRTYSQSGPSISLVMKTVAADGSAATSRTTYQLDGKDYPVMGSADYDSLSARQIDSHTAEFTLKKGGKAIGTTSRKVSKDGKTLVSEMKVTAAQGGPADSTLVFDKQ
ncbi:hypothetical protein [Steroidobacter sp.]|uniref:hypothetical protein n=1 Tax=Steroidobacter sp. TaxID=1978227 RepID=UPI001A5C3BBF|nr:hypothetical protein [Steroidobacter sp.]MBL8266548.1 hypothetical protein [Steroidobacter sp.]